MQTKDIKDKTIILTKKLDDNNIDEHEHHIINDIDDMFTKTRLLAETSLRRNHGNNHP